MPKQGHRDFLEKIAELYSVVYAEPPYREGSEQVARFATVLPEEMKRAGFASVTANDLDRLVGATYGWTMDAGRWFSNADQEPSPEILKGAKFAVMEWIVHPEYRGKGIGRQLLTRLLTNRREPWAVLASDPRSGARGIYARNSWQAVGTSALPWGPAMDLLALPLTARDTG